MCEGAAQLIEPIRARRSRRTLRLLHSFSAMDNRRRTIGGAAGKAVFGCFAVVIDGHELLDESGSIVETVDVDHCADAGRGLADGADIDAAASAIRNSAVREPKR